MLDSGQNAAILCRSDAMSAANKSRVLRGKRRPKKYLKIFKIGLDGTIKQC